VFVCNLSKKKRKKKNEEKREKQKNDDIDNIMCDQRMRKNLAIDDDDGKE
jgi:hypothetical protein